MTADPGATRPNPRSMANRPNGALGDGYRETNEAWRTRQTGYIGKRIKEVK